MDEALGQAVTAALGARVQRMRTLGGGDVAEARRVELDAGRIVFAKTHRDPPPGCFTTEAASLGWLRAAEAVQVPEVLSVGDGDDGHPAHLVLSWIEEDRRGPAAADEASFGRALAAMHQAGSPCFGREDRRPTGSRSLPNEPTTTWIELYAECRLRPLAHLAERSNALDGDGVAALHRVADRLETIGGPPEPPARLHGDLWAGNRLVDGRGTSWLIDPAAHGGHREFDLAMMRLFGGFGPDVFAAYDEVHPLASGWAERVPLHQLAPLTVHAIKFGGSYVAATLAALRACGEQV